MQTHAPAGDVGGVPLHEPLRVVLLLLLLLCKMLLLLLLLILLLSELILLVYYMSRICSIRSRMYI